MSMIQDIELLFWESMVASTLDVKIVVFVIVIEPEGSVQ
jgi:hypothetical protein